MNKEKRDRLLAQAVYYTIGAIGMIVCLAGICGAFSVLFRALGVS
jgi:hypothetical protein